MTDQTNPSEAAAASSPDRLQVSDLPAAHALQAIAHNSNGFFPSTMQAMAVEILRMRRDCPPTAEVEQMRAELTSLRQAIGLMTTAKPDMEVDVRDPVGMAQKVVAMVEQMRRDLLACAIAIDPSAEFLGGRPFVEFVRPNVPEGVRKLRDDRDAWKRTAGTLGGDLNRIRSLVPTASDEQTTFDAVQAELQQLRDIAERNGKAATERGDLIERLHSILFCTFPASPTMEEQAKALAAAARNGAPPVVGYDHLFMAHRPGAWSSEADDFFVYRRVGTTPWVTVDWRHGPGVSNSDNNDQMALDTFLRRCGVDMTRAEGLPLLNWLRAAAKCVEGVSSLPAEAQNAIAAMRDVGPELAKAGIQVGPRCSHAEAVAQLRGERDRWREKFEAAEKEAGSISKWLLAMCDRLAEAGFEWTGAASYRAGLQKALTEALAELVRLRKESKRDRAEKQQALLDEIARLLPGKGPLLERVRHAAKVESSVWRDRFMRLRDGIKVQIAWCSTPGGTPHPAMLAEHRVLSCALKNAEAMLCEATGDRAKVGPATGGVVGASDFLKAMRSTEPKPGADRGIVEEAARKVADQRAAKWKQVTEELRQVVNRNSLESAGGDTPDYLLAEAMLDALLAFGKTTRARDAWNGFRPFAGFAFDPADPIGSKVGPATGQPRTEVPRATDGSGKVVELGEAFRVAMRESGTADHEGQRLRWLRDAVAELAKAVERIGAR